MHLLPPGDISAMVVDPERRSAHYGRARSMRPICNTEIMMLVTVVTAPGLSGCFGLAGILSDSTTRVQQDYIVHRKMCDATE